MDMSEVRVNSVKKKGIRTPAVNEMRLQNYLLLLL
jgi:hypothetical protein